MIRLGVLGSTKGTDLVPIVDAIQKGELNASVEIVISNNKSALVLEKAKNIILFIFLLIVEARLEKILTKKFLTG